jgi:hypothetical protein
VTPRALARAHTALFVAHAILVREQERLVLYPDDIAGHRAHRQNLRDHIERLRAHLIAIRAARNALL